MKFVSSILLSFICLSSLLAAPKESEKPKLPTAESSKPFRFIGGDAERGWQAFSQLQCVQCHRVEGADLPKFEGKRRLDLKIGKDQRFVKRYEDLITAITNPKHVVTKQYQGILNEAERAGGIEPFMHGDFAQRMTAQQLIDLVTFLDEKYKKGMPQYGK